MPIDTSSEAWTGAESYDPVTVEIDQILYGNSDQAFSVAEIEGHLHEEHPHLFPDPLVGQDAVEGTRAARISIVSNILEEKYWKEQVTYEWLC